MVLAKLGELSLLATVYRGSNLVKEHLVTVNFEKKKIKKKTPRMAHERNKYTIYHGTLKFYFMELANHCSTAQP